MNWNREAGRLGPGMIAHSQQEAALLRTADCMLKGTATIGQVS